MAKLILMLGPSGSGKSTYVRRRFPGRIILNADSIRREITGSESDQSRNGEVFRLLRRRLALGLRDGRSVVVDNTNVQQVHREELYRIARDCGAQVEVHVMQTPLDECVRRNAARDRRVPDEVIARQYEDFLRSLGGLPHEIAAAGAGVV